MEERRWKVGELARETGLTVRTLHHYDALGLVSPSGRTEAGHRLYGAEDVARLQQVQSLRGLGLSLEEIRECLRRPDHSPRRVVEDHLARVEGQIALQQQLRNRLEHLAGLLRSGRIVSADDLIRSIAAMSNVDSYYTPEQLAYLRQRYEQTPPERLQAVESEWKTLIAEVRAAVAAGMDPATPEARELARRWEALIAEFTGGDPGIREALGRMYRNEPELSRQHGMENGEELTRFIQAAFAGVRG